MPPKRIPVPLAAYLLSALALCAPRTAAASNEFQELWRQPLFGTLEGAPILASGRLIVTELEGAGRRALRVLDPRTGAELAPRRSLRTDADLGVSVWRDRLLVRSGPRKLEVWALNDRRLATVWSHTSTAPMGGGVLGDGTVYAVVDGGIGAFAPGRRAARWHVAGAFRGTPALEDDELAIVRYDAAGTAALVWLAADDGRQLRTQTLGRTEAEVPASGTLPRIHLSETDIVVEVAAAVLNTAGKSERFVWDDRRRPGGGFRTAGLLSEPALIRDGWIGWCSADKQPFLQRMAGNQGSVLADPETFPELVAALPPPRAAGSTVALGSLLFSTATGRVRWSLPSDVPGTLVRAAHPVLASTKQSLIAYAPRASTAGDAAYSAFGKRPHVLPAGVLALSDGRVLRGRVDWNPRTRSFGVRDTAGSATAQADATLWVEDQQARCWHARTDGDAVRGVQAITNSEVEALLARLLPEAGASRDAELLGVLLDEASARGIHHRAVTDGVRRLELLEAQPAVRIDAPRAARVRRELAAIDGIDATSLWKRIHALDPKTGVGLRSELLDALLALDRADIPGPVRSRASAAVIELLPPDLPAPRGFDPRAWLGFARRTVAFPVRVLGRGAAEEARMEAENELLDGARKAWRRDLYGFESENLLVISPLEHPDAIPA